MSTATETLTAALTAAVTAAHAAATGNWTDMSWDSPDTERRDEAAAECTRAEAEAERATANVADGTWDEGDDAEEKDVLDAARRELQAAQAVVDEYEAEVMEHARQAELDASAALAHAEAGDWDEALAEAQDASSHEREYGDDPTWGGFLRSVETARQLSGAVVALEDGDAEAARTLLDEAGRQWAHSSASIALRFEWQALSDRADE